MHLITCVSKYDFALCCLFLVKAVICLRMMTVSKGKLQLLIVAVHTCIGAVDEKKNTCDQHNIQYAVNC